MLKFDLQDLKYYDILQVYKALKNSDVEFEFIPHFYNGYHITTNKCSIIQHEYCQTLEIMIYDYYGVGEGDEVFKVTPRECIEYLLDNK